MLATAILVASALVFLSAAIQHLNTIFGKGLEFVISDRSAPLAREGFAGRAARTLQNNLESAAMFIPPALLLVMSSSEAGVVHAAAGIYAVARIGFTLAYWSGLNPLRTLFWAIGMASIAITTASAVLAVIG